MGALVPLLAPHFTVFTYDRRGRGESGDRKPYAVEREVEDLDALIKEAGGGAYVARHSARADGLQPLRRSGAGRHGHSFLDEPVTAGK
jgi:pimeloyl-ACP methyl ester carboxylesterase